VITDLTEPNSDWYEWAASTLERLDCNHHFVINPIIYAECSIVYDTIEEVESLIKTLDLEVKNLPRESLFLAGKVFLNYRRNQGTKSNVLPDFFIGAHAAVTGYKIMTRDKGRFASYFPNVELMMPVH